MSVMHFLIFDTGVKRYIEDLAMKRPLLGKNMPITPMGGNHCINAFEIGGLLMGKS